MDNNYLNLKECEYDLPVYHTLPFKFILNMLITNKLTLVKTKKWEDADPWENFYFKWKAFRPDKKTPVEIEHIRELIFGQCWSLLPESDALWRIYSPNKDSVRIKSTIRKLLDVIFDENSNDSRTSSFIGKVEYKAQQGIEVYYSNQNNLGKSGEGIFDTHLIKREEFEHEKEVRLLYRVNLGSSDSLNDIICFNIEPNDLIDDIMLDPRINDLKEENIYRKTLEMLGYQNPIIKSTLYDFKSIDIILPFD